MIFQDPLASLNPCFTVAYQLDEALRVHGTDAERRSARVRRAKVLELLRQVEIPDAEARLRAFPHQLSGGMAQRVMIAMAIACQPRLLIADEPTTALDVTVQAQVLDLLRRLQRERGMALLLITHDLAVVAETAHRVVVMYAGQQVETGPVPAIFEAPQHPYTQALLASLPEHNEQRARLNAIPGIVPGQHDRPTGCLLSPRCTYAVERCRQRTAGTRRPRRAQGPLPLSARCPGQTYAWMGARCPSRGGGALTAMPAPAPLLQAAALSRYYAVSRGLLRPKGLIRALDGVAFSLREGETLAVVGESGCGKSTLARQVTMIERPTGGELKVDGVDVARADRATLKRLRPLVQMVFQNPYASLNPRKKVGTLLEEPLAINTDLERGCAPGRGAGHAGESRSAPRALPAISAHVLRRPATAHRGGARLDDESAARGRRRAGVRARRFDPGPSAQPAHGCAATTRGRLPLHFPQSASGAPHRRRGCGHVFGEDRRVWPEGRHLSASRSIPTRARCWRARRFSVRRRGANGRS